jgi:hypothetical protein
MCTRYVPTKKICQILYVTFTMLSTTFVWRFCMSIIQMHTSNLFTILDLCTSMMILSKMTFELCHELKI